MNCESSNAVLKLATFEIGESQCFQGSYSWRLKEGELRYRGTKSFEKLVIGRVPVSSQQLERFVAALNLLDVWRWRDDYKPSDAGWEVLDGGSWSFKANIGDRSCKAAGENAFPSYEDPQKTSTDPDRFRLLSTALYQCFAIDAHVEYARRCAENAKKFADQRSEPD